tara:strand:- start:4027 stop:4479 length:453 start_codon:yes stop_codon:yes gene_type:complete
MTIKLLHENKYLTFYSFTSTQVINIPFYEGGVSAGFPSPAEDYMHSKLDLNDLLIDHPSATYYVRVNGDSMLGAGIHSGDLLVVDRSLEVVNSSIVVANINGEFTVKRIKKIKNKMFLQPENKNYKPIEITEEMDFELFGVVAHVIHHFI